MVTHTGMRAIHKARILGTIWVRVSIPETTFGYPPHTHIGGHLPTHHVVKAAFNTIGHQQLVVGGTTPIPMSQLS